MTVKGTVASVIFYNSENGYSVISLDTVDGDDIVVVGTFPALSVGEVLTVTGRETYHQRYGEQLVAESYTIDNPTTRQGIVRYLGSGLVKGVGEVTANNIYDVFGGDTLNIIETNPMLLSKVKGISDKKAMDIAKSVGQLKKMQSQIMFLQQYNISTNLAMKIYNTYKDHTKSIVSANPYKLIDDVDGVGFATADKIALSMGHDLHGSFRIRASVVYALKDSADKQGNTYLTRKDLVDRCNALLNMNLNEYQSLFEDVLTGLVLEPTIKMYSYKGEDCVALARLYSLESAIATRLIRHNHEVRRISMDSNSIIEQFQQTNRITFHHSQRQAIMSATLNGVSVITGGPGTGKTTIIKCIAEIFSTNNLRVEMCAPTGRAAKRLQQSTGYDAKTIHRLLGLEFRDGKTNFRFNQSNPLPCDVVIVDEVSMTDVYIMSSLLRALDSGTRLVMVGDKDQLPSVGAGNVLADIINSRTIDVNYLTYIYRQSEDSLIVSNAHLINQCKMPEINNSGKDFFVMSINDLTEVHDTVIQLVTTRLPKFTNVSPRDIQVLGALKSGVAGVENLNVGLQQAINPPRPDKGEVAHGKTVFRQGDRVMQTVNNYEMPYTRMKPDGTVEEGTGVFNGDIGFVTRVDKVNGYVEVEFDDNRISQYTANDLGDLQLSYAITVHKSQGSEFDVAVIPLVNGPPTIINKNLLYTAITRAKKVVVLVGSKKVLAMMIHNNYIAARTTMLEWFLKLEEKKFNTFFTQDD